MNLLQRNRLEQVKHVRDILERYRAEWQTKLAFVKAVFQLDNEITFIVSAGNLTMQGTQSFTIGKNKELHLIAHELVWLTGVLYSWADDHQDEVLKDMCDVALTDYSKLSKPAFTSAFQTLVKKAVEVGEPALREYGVDPDLLQSYQIMASELDMILGKPKLDANDLKALRQQITNRLARVRNILKRRVRNLMVPFKRSNGTFWSAFEAAMVIVDRKAGHPPSVDEVVVG